MDTERLLRSLKENRVASLDDMIKMKRAAGRAKDREDLKYLKKLKAKNANRALLKK